MGCKKQNMMPLSSAGSALYYRTPTIAASEIVREETIEVGLGVAHRDSEVESFLRGMICVTDITLIEKVFENIDPDAAIPA